MSRLLILIYGTVCYFIFLPTFVYTIGFVANIAVPKGIDDGAVGAIGQSIIVNLVLLSAFAIQHTIMARPAFKTAWTKIIPEPIERATFVLFTCTILCTMFWQWQPMPETIWDVSGTALGHALLGLSGIGWIVVLVSTFLIDHFDLFGWRQVILHFQGKEHVAKNFVTPLFYKFVRNPLMLGFMIAFWATPTMSQGHLLFAAVTSAYMIFGIHVEENDLKKILGDEYLEYRARTPMIIPFTKFGG